MESEDGVTQRYKLKVGAEQQEVNISHQGTTNVDSLLAIEIQMGSKNET